MDILKTIQEEREAIDFLSKFYKRIFEEGYFTETLRGTKFNYLIEEANR